MKVTLINWWMIWRRMVLTISTTKLFLAEILDVDYNFHRWTSKPTENYSVSSKRNLQATWTTHNNEKSAVQEVYDEFGIRVYPIVTVVDIIEAIEDGTIDGKEHLEAMKKYRETYGI